MKNILYLIAFLITTTVFAQLPPATLPDGIITPFTKYIPYTTVQRDALTLSSTDRTIIYHLNISPAVNRFEQWDGDSWEVIGSGGSSSSVVEELTNPIDAFQGNRISPINDVNGYINDVNIDGATGYLSKNISTGTNAYAGFTATTGNIYTQGFSLSHFNSGYFQPYLRNNTLLYGTDDLIFIAGKNDSNIKFRLGNSATSLLTEAGTDEILSLNADRTILAPSLTPALITSGGNSSLITKEYGDANYLGSGSDLSNYVTLDGSQTITGTKNFNVSGGGSNIVITNTNAGYGLYLLNSGTNHGMYIGNGVDDKSGINVYNNATTNGNALFASNSSNTGNAIFSQSSFSGTGIYSNISGSGDGIVSNGDNDSTGNLYVGKNNGTNTFTVSKTGVVTANSFIGDGSGLTGIVGSGFDPSLNQTITGDWIFNGAVTLDFVNFTSSPDFGNNTLTGVANGAAADEAVNKAQLDAVAATIPTSVNTGSTLVAYNATVSDAYTSAQPNRHITLAGNSDITVTGGVSGDTGLWYLYGTGTATLNNTDASTLVVPVSGNLKVVYFLVDKDDNLTWYQDENSGGSGAVAVQTATGDGTTTINWTVSPFMDFTFGAFNEIIIMTPPTYPERLRLKLTQDGVGSRTITWGNNVYVPSGIMPTLSTGAGDIDVINLFWNGVDFEIDEDFLDYQLVAGSDATPPTAPTGLASSNVTETTLDLTWTAATDNIGVTNYRIYQDAVAIATIGNVLTYQAIGLTTGTSYTFEVTALDAAGNESVASASATLSTSAGADLSAFVMDMTTATDGGTVDFMTSWVTGQAYTVDWGDGNSETLTPSGSSIISHVYTTAGTYEVAITGVAWKGIHGAGSVLNDIVEIKQWGTSVLTSCRFGGNTALTTISAIDAPVFGGSDTAFQYGFKDCTALTSINNIGSWDVTPLTNISEAFRNCTALVAGGLSGIENWDTSNITNMSSTFQLANNFNYDLGSWNIGSVTTLSNFLNTNQGGWSPANYDATLIGWAAQTPNITNSLTFKKGSVTRTAASDAAFTTLTTTHLWTISN